MDDEGMKTDWRQMARQAEEAGRYGLEELFFQKALASGSQEQELLEAYGEFHARQERESCGFLQAIYEELDACLDGSNLQLLLEAYTACNALLNRNVSAVRLTEDWDPVTKALYDDLQRMERLIFYLAGTKEWSLLPQELENFPEDEQELWQALRDSRREKILQQMNMVQVAEQPLVSIMIPTYNLPEVFERTMRSAAIQDYPNLEILVADNSTNEETAELMKSYEGDARVRYLRNPSARSKEENFAVFEKMARGEYLQWLMHDDILFPGKVRRMAAILRDNPQVALVASQRAIIDGRGMVMDCSKIFPEIAIAGECQSFAGEDLGAKMLGMAVNVIGEPSAVLFRRRDLQNHYWHAGCKGYVVISDVAMWLELLGKGDAAIFKESLSGYRRHGAQEGQRADICLLSRLEWYRLMQECLQEKRILSSWKQCIPAMDSFIKEYDVFHAVSLRVGGALSEEYENMMEEIRKLRATL